MAARSVAIRKAIAVRVAIGRGMIAERLATGMKRCSACRAVKPLEAFHIDRSHPDGRNYRCAICATAWQRARRQPPPVRPLAGWELSCCGGELDDDPVTGFWRCVHRPGCTDRWQPGMRGGSVTEAAA